MPTQERVFDPEDVYQASVAGRSLVYLDTSVLVTLADGRSEKARACLAVCETAVREGRVLFPMSSASILELFEHPKAEPRRRQAAVMDALSLGVASRPLHKVHDVEVMTVASVVIGEGPLPPRRELLFTYVMESLGDLSTSFENQWSETDATAFMAYMRAAEGARSLSWWVRQEGMLASIRAHNAESKARYVARMRGRLEESRTYLLNGDGSLNRTRALREEHVWALKNELTPRLRNAILARFGPERTFEVLRSFTRRNGEGSSRRLGELLGLMPTLNVFCEAMAARTMNPTRDVQGQDLWDVEHVAAGSVHHAAFATLDRGLRNLVESRCSTPKERGCRILHDIDGLTAYVGSLPSS